jgi:hypothetical protein
MASPTFSFKKAAERILRDADRPLSPQEIVERALESGLIDTDGATPDATMGAQLYLDIRDNSNTPFIKVGRGKFTLKEARGATASTEVFIANQNRAVREELRTKLLSMEPAQFEVLVSELLEKLGYESVRVTGQSGDKGIDIKATLTMGGITSVKTVVQVKRYKVGSNIPGSVIAQLRGSAEVDQRGLVITTSDFTKEGINEAVAPNKMPVALVNGEKLLDLLLEHEIGVKRESMPVYSLASDYFDNAGTEDDDDTGTSKKRGLWPLPGGIDAYVDTLFRILDAVGDHNLTRREMVLWIMKEFPQVRSEKTAGGYVNVPRAIGLTQIVDGKTRLTEDGRRVRESRDRDLLYSVFSKNILGVEEIMEFLKTAREPQTEVTVLALLRGCPIGRAANLLWNGQPSKHETDQTELNVANT